MFRPQGYFTDLVRVRAKISSSVRGNFWVNVRVRVRVKDRALDLGLYS